MKKSDKNISLKVKIGQRVQTRDEYLENANDFTKTSHKESIELYRPAIVIDTNKDDEVALVKVTHSKRGKVVKNYDNENIRVRPFIHTKDEKGKPLKISHEKLQRNKKKKKISKSEINKIKKDALINISDDKIKESNKKKLKELKGRK